MKVSLLVLILLGLFINTLSETLRIKFIICSMPIVQVCKISVKPFTKTLQEF